MDKSSLIPEIHTVNSSPFDAAASTPQICRGHVSTQIILISDTHNTKLFDAGDGCHAFRKPLPEADILIHAGDLSNRGTQKQLRVTYQVVAEAKAELKLVIAGNHDISLDSKYMKRHVKYLGSQAEKSVLEEEADEATWNARELWTGDEAKAHNIHFLDEGVHIFGLSNGAKFTVYASPFTPEFCDWAFAYPRDVDRFNPPKVSSTDSPFLPQNPIPSFPNVDLIVTHGPPAQVLDKCQNGTHAGCQALWSAVQRARPRLHVFGHIHEGFGAMRLNWTKRNHEHVENPDNKVVLQRGWVGFDGTGGLGALGDPGNLRPILDSHGPELRFGEETLFVNASIMNETFMPMNAPFLVDLMLPSS